MQVLLEELYRHCKRVQALDRFDMRRLLAHPDLEAEMERLQTFTDFEVGLACLVWIMEKRDRLNPERRQKLERISSDAELEGQLRRLLLEMRSLELPEDLIYCVMQHRPVCAALDERLHQLFEGLE